MSHTLDWHSWVISVAYMGTELIGVTVGEVRQSDFGAYSQTHVV